MSSATLSIEGLSKWFGGLCAADSVSFELSAGRISSLIGPNGAGKTTVFNMITGTIRPDSGVVKLGAQSIGGLPAHQIARLGIARTFQDVRVIARMSALDNVLVAFPNQTGETLWGSFWRWGSVGRKQRQIRDEALSLLDFVGLASETETMAGDLTYAEQKLLSFARLFATGAQVLLLDEPASGLDHVSMKRQIEILRSLREQGRAVCVVEHNFSMVREIADEVLFMDQGRLIATGTPDAIAANPRLTDLYFGKLT